MGDIAYEGKESNMTLRFTRNREQTPHRSLGLASRGLRRVFFSYYYLLPIPYSLFPITFLVVLLAALLPGCSKGGGEGGGTSLNSMVQKLSGPSPGQLAAWAFDPNDPDRRRQGIVGLSSKDWGLKEPYLKGYAALLKTDRDPLVRAAAVRALGRAQDANYAPDVTRALLDADATVRQDAAIAADKVYDGSSAAVLRNRAISDVDQDVRANSCRALRHHRDMAVVRTLVECLSDKAFSVRYQAHESLVEVVGKDLGYDGQEWADVAGARALAPKAAPADELPWWDWMRITQSASRSSTTPAPAAPKAAPADELPWWDWMRITKPASGPSTGPAQAAPKAAPADEPPWWDWMRITKPASGPSTGPAQAAPKAAPNDNVVTPKTASPAAPRPPKT
jgi:hypothetical protein